ncbi:MAG: tetratricopeptide repeat protein, partial [Hyphomicrobiales bacterium]|nr:tetratricopeptide repeat protein [Hyphomicrobiales bacterium]
MSDNFLREIDEEVRRDKAADLWKKYGNLIIVLLALLVVAVGGWRFWQYRQEQAAHAVSARLEEALKA